jgi:hypothetical protein
MKGSDDIPTNKSMLLPQKKDSGLRLDTSSLIIKEGYELERARKEQQFLCLGWDKTSQWNRKSE